MNQVRTPHNGKQRAHHSGSFEFNRPCAPLMPGVGLLTLECNHEHFRELQLSQEWIDLGIITEAKLIQIEAEWLDSDDRNPEHYRWRAFLDFSNSQASLDPITARRLYDLGAKDPDPSMGGSMMAHVVRRKDCPEDVARSGGIG